MGNHGARGRASAAGSSVIARIAGPRRNMTEAMTSMKIAVKTADRSPLARPPSAPRGLRLPTLFTAGNVFLGFYAIIEAFQGAHVNAPIDADSRRARHFKPPRSPSGSPCFSTAWTAASRA